jgi:hypothetical protein
MVQEVPGRLTIRIRVLPQQPVRVRALTARRGLLFTTTDMELPHKQPMLQIIMVKRLRVQEIQTELPRSVEPGRMVVEALRNQLTAICMLRKTETFIKIQETGGTNIMETDPGRKHQHLNQQRRLQRLQQNQRQLLHLQAAIQVQLLIPNQVEAVRLRVRCRALLRIVKEATRPQVAGVEVVVAAVLVAVDGAAAAAVVAEVAEVGAVDLGEEDDR